MAVCTEAQKLKGYSLECRMRLLEVPSNVVHRDFVL